jgi:TRAP-type C4-dicarboxylate transport system substrate-binding protein
MLGRTLSRLSLTSCLLVSLVSGVSSADPVVLKLAAIAPEGTSWAREVRAFARDVETSTNGAVKVKWYLGGIAGDELQSLDRMRRGQLDGVAVSQACTRLAPSLRVSRVIGLFQSRDEARHIYARLFPTVEQEMSANGYSILTISAFGDEIIFSRTPVRSMTDLRKLRAWFWELDEVWRNEWPALGVNALPLSVNEGTPAYESGKIDSYFVLPTAAIAYQWSSVMRYYTPMPLAYMPACLVIANRALDSLPHNESQAIRAAGAKLGARFDIVNEDLEKQLLGGLFEKQGLQGTPPSQTFQSEFFAQARRARERLDPKLVPPALIEKVNGWLADFRAEHR